MTSSARGLDNAGHHPAMLFGRRLESSSEAELVEHLRASGEVRYFEELYRRSRRRVLAVCLRIVGDPGRAEELCHDAFVRAFQSFDRFVGTTFVAWVCRIGVNLSLNEVRHRQVAERAAHEPEPSAAAAGAERRLVSREALALAMEIIDRLEPHQRRVFLLRHVDELSYAEIAERTGWSGEQVRSFLQNGRRNFRVAWERRAEEERRREDLRHG
ncbi:MAG TPA: RNA polymerase sigma factor [Planctomycetota bacterium]|nr:RNA polymerase sigma factor [Planctomycetota bacterium]